MAPGITIRSVEPPSIKPDTYRVVVDDQIAGVVSYSSPLEISLEPGLHTISLRGPFFTRSGPLEFFLRSDQHLEFECGTDYDRWYTILGPVAARLLSTDAIWLRHSGVSV